MIEFRNLKSILFNLEIASIVSIRILFHLRVRQMCQDREVLGSLYFVANQDLKNLSYDKNAQ